jgi:hypothetical protein
VTIAINTENLRGKAAPLFSYCREKEAPLWAFVEMSERGTVRAGVAAAPSEAMRRGRAQVWTVSPYLNGDALADFLEHEARMLLERVHAGLALERVGSKRVGRLSEEAKTAARQLVAMFESLRGVGTESCIVTPSEYLDLREAVLDTREHWPEEACLAEAARALSSEAAARGILIFGDLETELLDAAEAAYRDGQFLHQCEFDALREHGRVDLDELIKDINGKGRASRAHK